MRLCNKLKDAGVYRDILDWAAGMSLREFWYLCPNGYWLADIAWRYPVPTQTLVRIAHECAGRLKELPGGIPALCETLLAAVDDWVIGNGDEEKIMSLRRDISALGWGSKTSCHVYWLCAACGKVASTIHFRSDVRNAVGDSAYILACHHPGGQFLSAERKYLRDSADVVRRHITFDTMQAVLKL